MNTNGINTLRPIDAAYIEPAYRLAQARWPGLYEAVRDNVAAKMTHRAGDWRTTVLEMVMGDCVLDDTLVLVLAALAQRASDELLAGN